MQVLIKALGIIKALAPLLEAVIVFAKALSYLFAKPLSAGAQ